MKSIKDLWKKLEFVELVQVRPSEMEALYKHAFEFEHPTILEIGSAHGASSIILAEAAKELGGHLICVDSYPEDYYDQDKFGAYAKKAFEKNVANKYPGIVKPIYRTSDSAFAEIRDMLDLNGKYFDIVFIDGSHEYGDVKKDCENYLPMLKSGGYVGFHDYNNVAFSGVKNAADEFTSDWESQSVWDLMIRRKP